MKFKIVSKTLKDSMRMIEDVIKRSPAAQSTVEILITADADKEALSLEAICRDVYVRHWIDAEIVEQGVVVVDSQHIRNLKFGNANAAFELKRNALLVRSGRFQASLETLPSGDDITDSRPGKPEDINGDVVVRSDALIQAIHRIALAPHYGGWLPMKITIQEDEEGHQISSITADELRAACYDGSIEVTKGSEIEILASSAYLLNMITKFEGSVRIVTTPRTLVLKSKTLEIRLPMLTEEEAYFPEPYELLEELKGQPKLMMVAIAADDMLQGIQQLKSLVTSAKTSPNLVLSQKKKELMIGIDTAIGKGRVAIENVRFKEESGGDAKIPMVFLREVFSLFSADALPRMMIWDGVVVVQYKDQDDQRFLYVVPTAQ